MTLNTEILIFNSSEALHSNTEIATKALKYALAVDGSNVPAYYGAQIENPGTVGTVFINSERHELHKAFSSHPTFPTSHEAFTESFADDVEVYDIEFSGPVVALDKPVTSIAVLTLKAPENRKAVVDILTGFSEASAEVHAVFGQTRQDENRYIIISGWPSVEVHQRAAAKPEMVAVVTELYSLASPERFYHTSLSQYKIL